MLSFIHMQFNKERFIMVNTIELELDIFDLNSAYQNILNTINEKDGIRYVKPYAKELEILGRNIAQAGILLK